MRFYGSKKKKDQKRQEGLRRLGMCNYFVIYKTVTAVPQQYNANHRVKLITSSTASFSLSSTKRPTLRQPYWQKTHISHPLYTGGWVSTKPPTP